MAYEPSPEIIERYGRLLIEFGLRDGAGIEPGETVAVIGSEETKPLFAEVCRSVWRAGGNVIQELRMTQDDRFNLEKSFIEIATDAQLDHFPAKYMRGWVDEVDHFVYLFGEDFPRAMAEVDPVRMMRNQAAMLPLVGWRQEKENAGNMHWTIGLWGTEAMAAEAGISVEEYWEQIIHACHLEDPDPVARWKETAAQIHGYRDWLNSLDIDRLHVEAAEIDLWITLGEKRRWVGGGGANIPSFEVFTSPDWRGTNGHIKFSEPLFSDGSLIKGARLEFRDGVVVDASADENAELLAEIVGAPNGNRIGEFSMTDARVSRVNRFMATTLYDENVGGPFGNTHVAVGMSILACYDGDASTVTDGEWERMGFNPSSPVHTDIVSTTDRTVTAVMHDGSERVIYAGGQFQNDA